MNVMEFNQYAALLEEKPFALYPAPQGIAENKFTFVTNDRTHLTIRHGATQRDYLLPLALVEFANPGVLRLTRAVIPFNGSFV